MDDREASQKAEIMSGKEVSVETFCSTGVFSINTSAFIKALTRATGCSRKESPFEMLEPCALKGASTVLRGLGAGNSPRLPDWRK